MVARASVRFSETILHGCEGLDGCQATEMILRGCKCLSQGQKDKENCLWGANFNLQRASIWDKDNIRKFCSGTLRMTWGTRSMVTNRHDIERIVTNPNCDSEPCERVHHERWRERSVSTVALYMRHLNFNF